MCGFLCGVAQQQGREEVPCRLFSFVANCFEGHLHLRLLIAASAANCVTFDY